MLGKETGFWGKVLMSHSSESLGKYVLNLYARAWRVSTGTPRLLGKAMADLKNRIGGHARLVSVSDDKIALEVTGCEFGNERIKESRGSLCKVA